MNLRFCLASAFIAMLLILSTASAGFYWFQTGAVSGSGAYHNNGAKVEIQTITPQSGISSGSAGFWTGENLDNGAFVQVGYLVENATGYYPQKCTSSGCGSYQALSAGDAEWFYEYFPSSSASSTFLGAIGPADSAGVNGTFNSYGFYSQGNTWYFLVDGNIVGNVSLGTGSSGNNGPVAYGEVANTSTSSQQLSQVIFRNLSFYSNGRFLPVPYGYSYVGYGVGSDTVQTNAYGIQELGSKVNYFAVGSSLPEPRNETLLWSLGYFLRVISQYGNVTSGQYAAYSSPIIIEPKIFYINSSARASFNGWVGSGIGAYTGKANMTSVFLGGNITETASWINQYLLNVSSQYSTAKGTGWYNQYTFAQYALSSNVSYAAPSSRYVFGGWSNGNMNLSGNVLVIEPATINANWQHQYFVNASGEYGNVSGLGWYNANSTATVFARTTQIPINSNSRLEFYAWSNGNSSSVLHLNVSSPINISTVFRKQYLTTFQAIDAYGNQVQAQLYVGANQSVDQPTFLFSGLNYSVSRGVYNGYALPLSKIVNLNGSSTVFVQMPLYNLKIVATDLFGSPVNASAVLNLQDGQRINTTMQNGQLQINDVPYGAATGTVSYLGVKYTVTAQDGNPVRLFFISTFDLMSFAALIIAAIVVYLASTRLFHRRRQQQNDATK